MYGSSRRTRTSERTRELAQHGRPFPHYLFCNGFERHSLQLFQRKGEGGWKAESNDDVTDRQKGREGTVALQSEKPFH